MKKTMSELVQQVNWATVQSYYDGGHNTKSCCVKFGLVRNWITLAAKQGLIKVSRKRDYEMCCSRYEWTKIQKYYDLGYSGRECCQKFRCSNLTFLHAAKSGRIVLRPFETHSEDLFTVTSKPYRSDQVHLKHRLIRERILPYRCGQCGISKWNGAIIGLELHHKNGDPCDNKKENLQLLCPNCHTQTPNYRGRKSRSSLKRPGALKESYRRLVNRLVDEAEKGVSGVHPLNLRVKKPEVDYQV